MKALVTGGGGFLGGHIVRKLLHRGDTVVSFARGAYPELAAMGVKVVRGDLSDAAAVSAAARGCDVVFHVAAKAGAWGAFDTYHQANVVGTQSVIDACRAQDVPRLVYTSTPSVVHAGGDIEGGDESLPYPEHFEAHYPATKAEAERRVRAANGDDLLTVSLRPHLVWGPGDNHLMPRIVARAKAGRLRLVGGGAKKVDAVYVENAADAHLLAADALAPGAACAGNAYFVTNADPRPQAEIVNGMLAAAGLPPCEKSISPKIAYAVGWAMETVWRLTGREDEPLMTRFVANQLATAHWYRTENIERDIGYRPAVSMEQGMERLAAAWATA